SRDLAERELLLAERRQLCGAVAFRPDEIAHPFARSLDVVAMSDVGADARDGDELRELAVPRLVHGVEQAARLQRQAPAADARRQPVTHRFERRDPLVELAPPGRREALPVALRRLLAVRQGVECDADALERDAGRLPSLDEGDPPERDGRIPALVAGRAVRGDESLPLVEAER